MDLREVRKLIALVERANIEEIEIEESGIRVRIRKSAPYSHGERQTVIAMPAAPAPEHLPVPVQPAAPLAERTEAGAARKPEDPSLLTINAPMVGTFYRAPAPDAPPYAKVGDEVDEDTVVCILEAMKVMNDIKAGKRGTIVEVLAENATAVEYGQPLFRLKPA